MKKPFSPSGNAKDEAYKDAADPRLVRQMQIKEKLQRVRKDESNTSRYLAWVFIGLILFTAMIFAGTFVDHSRKAALVAEINAVLEDTMEATILKTLDDCDLGEAALERYAREQFEARMKPGYMGADPIAFDPVVMKVQGEIRFKAKTEIPNYFLLFLGSPTSPVHREMRLHNYRDYAARHMGIRESIADRCVMVIPR